MPYCLDLDLSGTCNSQECIQQMTQHLKIINILPSLPLLLILDSQSKIPSKNTLWPLDIVRACCINAGLVSVWLLKALNSWSILSMNSAVPVCVSCFFCNMY